MQVRQSDCIKVLAVLDTKGQIGLAVAARQCCCSRCPGGLLPQLPTDPCDKAESLPGANELVGDQHKLSSWFGHAGWQRWREANVANPTDEMAGYCSVDRLHDSSEPLTGWAKLAGN